MAGRTSLALRFGHRLSVDLDLFTNRSFDTAAVYETILTAYPTLVKTDEAQNTLSLYINGVKVDLIAHRYPIVQAFQIQDKIRLWSIEDVSATKLGAVSNRGAKKDFWDIAELLNHVSLAQMLEWFSSKYTNSDIGYVIRSLTYFDDADLQEDPISLRKVTWEQIRQHVLLAVRQYVRG
ncbi:nucleotidyl transferase AbiEii/AbiGii toxin family protein [Nibrella viscosa]|uniref:Nucleotidyl transferase AbiEii/AbiGii toxin family protein n=1 Tax=Nibrella viscosa TaxID=1084524 RepID=A0ABP8KMG2_9BACT